MIDSRTQSYSAMMQLSACICVLLLLTTACGKKDEPAPVSTAEPAPTSPATDPVGGAGSLFSAAPLESAAVATVNGVSLSRAELNARVGNALSSPQYASLPPQTREMLSQRIQTDMINSFVTRELLRSASLTEEVEVAESNIVAAISQIESGIPAGQTLDDMLGQSGITMQEFRDRLVEDIRIRELLHVHMEAVPKATAEEIDAYYAENPDQFTSGESVSASHVLVKVEPGADEAVKAEKRKLAESHRQALVDGKDFAELAREVSEGPSGPNGGSLGTFGRGQMVKEFEDAAFSQEVDAIGEIVETQFGYHIIQVQAHNEAGVRPLEQARPEIEGQLNGTRQQAAFDAYVQELRAKADVTIAGQAAAAAPEGSGR